MKPGLSAITFLLLIIACSTIKTSTKVSVTPAGEWEYSVKETPEGDFYGIMTVAQQDKSFSAKLNSNGNDLPFENFTWDDPTKKVGGEFYYSGTSVKLDALLEGDEMTGTMSTSSMSFPFKATRKK